MPYFQNNTDKGIGYKNSFTKKSVKYLWKDAVDISQENREHNKEIFYLTYALFPKKILTMG